MATILVGTGRRMQRRIMRKLALALVFASVWNISCVSPGATGQFLDETASAIHETLKVSIELPSEPVEVDNSFEARVQVMNVTHSTQHIQVWTCSKENNWKTDNARVHLVFQRCWGNSEEPVEIPPGGTYKTTLDMQVNSGERTEESFKLGFTSSDGKRTYWSLKTTVHIKTAKETAKP
jgi:hypothetical protein